MKKIISVIIIAAMLLASSAAMIPTLANDVIADDNINNDINNDINNEEMDSGALEDGVAEARDRLLEAINKASALIISDYSKMSGDKLLLAIESAKLIYDDDSAEYSAILEGITAIENAIADLHIVKPDISKIRTLYTTYKYSDTKARYNQIELAEAMAVAEEAINNPNLLMSEAKVVENILNSVSTLLPINSAEEFMAIEPDGCYVLNSDIALDEPYGEFKGYIYGNGYSITISVSGVFNALNGAVVIGLTINGSVERDTSIGALADTAMGEVTVIDVVNNANIITSGESAVASGLIAELDDARASFSGCVNNGNISGYISAGFLGRALNENNDIKIYNCINNGDIVGETVATGFVASTVDGTTENIALEYCASFGNISADNVASGFFGLCNSNIKIYGCVIGGMDFPLISAESNADAFGGVVGYVDGDYCVNIISCYFRFNLKANNNAAFIIYASENVKIMVKSTYAMGDFLISGINAFRLSNIQNDNLIYESTYVNLCVEAIVNDEKIEDPNDLDGFKNVDFTKLDQDWIEEANYGIVAFVSSSTTLNAELKAESVELHNASLDMFVPLHKTSFYEKKNELMSFVNSSLIAPEGYSVKSYALYIAEINSLIAKIESATDIDALYALDCEGKVAAAEQMLVTLLDGAKADALTLLSAKRENAGKVFTKESYEEYSKAYDLIVETINSAETVEEVYALNLPALKIEAENKLVVNVRIVIEEDDEDVKEDIIEEDVLEEENQEQDVDDSKDESGCSLSIGISAIAVVSIIGAGVLYKRKD